MSVTLIIAPPDGSDRQYDHLTYALRETGALFLDILEVQEGLRENRAEQERIERAAWKPALSAHGAQLAVMSSWRRRCSAVSASGLKRGSLPPRRSRSSVICPPLLLEANGVRRHIEGAQCERHRGEPPHEDGDIDDARFSD